MTFWQARQVLVTGGAGFIGHRVVQKLIELGANVTVVDDLSKGAMENLQSVLTRIQFSSDNLLDAGVTEKLLSNIDICFHLAAKIGGIAYFHRTPAESLRDNSIMNFNLWDAAKGSDVKMVCLSSSMVFERTNLHPTSEIALERCPPPMSGYGFSKLVAEYISRTYHEQFGIDYLIVRPFNAYGPGETPGDYVGYAHAIPDLIKKTLSDQYPLEILGSGQQTRSYTYVDDVADAIIFLAERCKNDDFNIGTGVETSVLDLAKRIWSLCHRKDAFAIKQMPGLEYDVQKRVPDVSKIQKLGWKPKVDLDQGLKITIRWLKSKLQPVPSQ
jgi:nucleoside-diphosphate-sugar epimerase